MSSSDHFSVFLERRRADLRRIAARTSGEYTIDDTMSEAWLIADKIGRRRGFPIDYLDKADQEQVLAWLHNELVRYAEKHIRYAIKLDKDWDKEEPDAAIYALARLLTAPEEFDPAIHLELTQNGHDPLALIRHSYSQASAYFVLLDRFDWSVQDLAEHLRVADGTLKDRIKWFGGWIKHQPSLFDCIQSIDLDFNPTLARRYAPRVSVESGSHQWAWEFGAFAVNQ